LQSRGWRRTEVILTRKVKSLTYKGRKVAIKSTRLAREVRISCFEKPVFMGKTASAPQSSRVPLNAFVRSFVGRKIQQVDGKNKRLNKLYFDTSDLLLF
jgi:hypothetical protein